MLSSNNSNKKITTRLNAEQAASLKKQISDKLQTQADELQIQEEKWEKEKPENLKIIKEKISEIRTYIENNKFLESKEEIDNAVVPAIDMDFISDLEQLTNDVEKDLNKVDDLLDAQQIALRTAVLSTAHQVTIAPSNLMAIDNFEKAAEAFSYIRYTDNSWMSPTVKSMLKKTGKYAAFGAANVLAIYGIVRMGMASQEPCTIVGYDDQGEINENENVCFWYRMGIAFGSVIEFGFLLGAALWKLRNNRQVNYQYHPLDQSDVNSYEKSQTQKLLACSARQFAKTARKGLQPEVIVDAGETYQSSMTLRQ